MSVTRVAFPLVIDGEDDDGNPKEIFNKRYSIDVGNKEKLKAIFASCKDIEEQAKNLGDNEEAFDKLEESLEEAKRNVRKHLWGAE